jgi:hypothetical protein
MKKYLLCIALFLLIFTLIACDGGNTADTTAAVTVEVTPTEAPTEAPTEPITEEETTVEEITTEEITTEEITTEEVTTATPVAGEDHGINRDGTPKKYITIRMDDGITQDAQMMEIMKKYGVDCCTFYINTGLFGANWQWVGQQFNRPDVTHVRYPRKRVESGIYDGFDVECHTLSHPSLKNLSEKQVTNEVGKDAANLERILGYKPVGLAWPGGDTEWNEGNIVTILNTTDIRYGSCTTRNTQMGLGKFSLPKYFMTWYPTCGFSDGDSLTLLNEFIKADCTEDMLFYVWGHGYELDLFNTWDKFETMIKTIAEAAEKDDSIVLVTNAEFYQLFKDEIPSWKE